MENGWHFPLINPVQYFDLQHYIDHVKEELEEFEKETDPEKKRLEAMDILQSAETVVRKYFERTTGKSFEEVKSDMISKNELRGYYKK